MILNVDRLRELKACESGIKVFAEAFPEGLDVSRWDASCQLGVLQHPELRKYLGWAWDKKLLPRLPMVGWNLIGANLSMADLSMADLSGANLSGAGLYEANLRWTNLSGADLSRANLYRADLRGASLSEANLTGTNLRGARLSKADLYGADLSVAKWDDRTPPAGWRVNAEGKLERC